MDNNSITPIIMCGGKGTRLWPLSRKSFPKQYSAISSKDFTLIQSTQNRLKTLDKKSPIIICNEDHRFIVAEQMREINVTPKSILLEPFGRNTFAAIVISTLKAIEDEKDPLLLVLSSDHHISNEDQFINAIKSGIKYANDGRIVTFGVIPTHPATGYGYIKSKKQINKDELLGVDIERFVEKPNLKTAKKFFLDRCFSWNSGIFLFRAKVLLDEVKKINPEGLKYCIEAVNKKSIDLDFQRFKKEDFHNLPDISFDIAIMEKTNIGTVIPLNAGWSDIGNWNSVWKVAKKDKQHNFIQGKVVLKESTNCLVESDDKLIYGLGLDNLIVVQSDDATLIVNQKNAERVKDIVLDLSKKKIIEGEIHKKIYRPWGHYISIAEDINWQIKLIIVHPGQSLSLQKHNFRSEHWVVVSGTAKIELDNKEITLIKNQSTYIPVGSLHRLSNPGKDLLRLVEVQSGTYLGEDDIIRIEDSYGRN